MFKHRKIVFFCCCLLPRWCVCQLATGVGLLLKDQRFFFSGFGPWAALLSFPLVRCGAGATGAAEAVSWMDERLPSSNSVGSWLAVTDDLDMLRLEVGGDTGTGAERAGSEAKLVGSKSNLLVECWDARDACLR